MVVLKKRWKIRLCYFLCVLFFISLGVVSFLGAKGLFNYNFDNDVCREMGWIEPECCFLDVSMFFLLGFGCIFISISIIQIIVLVRE